jgi:hypothetical protein
MSESPATPCSLAQTLAHVRALDDNFVADAGVLQDGWFQAADLLQPGSAALAAALERQRVTHPQMEARTKGAYFINDYCTTCVLRKPEDRDARMLQYMAKKYAREAAS